MRPPRRMGSTEVPAAVDLAAAMVRPGFYGTEVGTVELRETHVSWVFLVGDRAYKLKKPLKLPFLDSSTVARRHTLCREEVRLNRRLAPDLYIEVHAIVAVGDGFRLAPEEEPGAVDYVVEMHRYDERATLAARLADGRIRRSDIAALGRLLAGFHAGAPRVRASASPVIEVEHLMEENFHELAAIVEQRAEFERVLALQRSSHAFLVAHAQTLAARADGGFVRELHGDLRAEHVVFGSALEIVDCIEFDQQLREMDVADELAFLVMDLTARGGERFGSALVDAYRAAGGDPGEDWLIAFYASYRALVRAKVALLRAGQYPANAHGRARESAAARDLLTLAERFAWRARLPLVIAVCGVPAVGKSSLARVLAQAAGLPHLSSDVIRKRLAGIAPTSRAGRGLYSPAANERTYMELGRLAGAELAARGGAIVDATFRHRSDRQAFARAFAKRAPVLFIECRAPAHVIARRAAERDRTSQHISDATGQVVAREMHSWEPLDEVSAGAHLLLRADLPVELQLADVSALIDQRLISLRGRQQSAAWPRS